MRLSLTYPGRSRDQRHRDRSAALLALPPPPAGRSRSGSPLPAKSSTKMPLSPHCSSNSPSFPYPQFFLLPQSLTLSANLTGTLEAPRAEEKKKKKETKEKKKSLTSGSQLNPESSRQPCPRGAGPLAPGRGLSPGGWSPEPSPHSPPPRRLPRAPQPRPAGREEAPLARAKGRKG